MYFNPCTTISLEYKFILAVEVLLSANALDCDLESRGLMLEQPAVSIEKNTNNSKSR